MESDRIQELKEQIQNLPQGGITYKVINGKRYAYYQWREAGKQRARRVKDDEFEHLNTQIEERKKLQIELSRLDSSYNPKKGSGRRAGKKAATEKSEVNAEAPAASAQSSVQQEIPATSRRTVVQEVPMASVQPQVIEIAQATFVQPSVTHAAQAAIAEIARPQEAFALKQDNPQAPAISEKELYQKFRELLEQEDVFSNHVRTGKTLERFISAAEGLVHRECYNKLSRFIYGWSTDRIFLLYGLRRTGKTTLIRQIISDMDEEARSKAAFIQISNDSTFEGLFKDLQTLARTGFRYVFADEVTLLPEILRNAESLAEVFAAEGMKIVLSGDDSLSFILAKDSRLYSMCESLNTTYIPFREYVSLKSIGKIDDYLKRGGVLNQPVESPVFTTYESTKRYVNTAIAANIASSLAGSQKAEFKGLEELAGKEGFADMIGQSLSEMNNSFAIVVMMRDFMSNYYNNRPRVYNSKSGSGIFAPHNSTEQDQSTINLNRVTAGMRELYRMKARNEQNFNGAFLYREELKKVLDLMDITADIDVIDISNYNKRLARTVFTQPGIRYADAERLVESLLEDDRFRDFTLAERSQIHELMLEKIHTRMLEDMVLFETARARKECRTFVLQFPDGCFDMVVFDLQSGTCSIYKIVNSSSQEPQHHADLIDPEKCAECEKRYGKIKGRYVIYRGKTDDVFTGPGTPDILYLNVEEYLLHEAKADEIPVDMDGLKIMFVPL